MRELRIEEVRYSEDGHTDLHGAVGFTVANEGSGDLCLGLNEGPSVKNRLRPGEQRVYGGLAGYVMDGNRLEWKFNGDGIPSLMLTILHDNGERKGHCT